jgi:hypothetical protein
MAQVRVRERGDRLTAGVQEVVGYEDDFVPPPWATELPAEAPRRSFASARPGNGNGNGHAYAPPSLPDEPAPPEPPAEAFVPPPPGIDLSEPPEAVVTPQPLSLVMRETEDEGGDQRRLAAVFRLLQENPGTDSVNLTIRSLNGEKIDLALPSAHLDDSLRRRLEEALSEAVAAG